jgi:oxalate decarboxylase
MPTQLRPFLFATFATLIAGFVDAVGYAHLGGLFLSFMSGNSTRLGMQMAVGNWHVVGLAATVVGCFLSGAFLGTLIADAAGGWKLVTILSAEVALFALAAVLTAGGADFVDMLPVAVAMGMQNSVHQIIAGADIGKSFVTGALFGLGQSLALMLSGKSSPREAAAYASSWASFVLGALIGTLLLAAAGLSMTLVGGVALLAALAATAYAFHGQLIRPVGESGGD